MEEDMEAKQQYLYAEVIEGGYDPEEFQEFLELKKPDGLNIDKWKLTELKEVNVSSDEGGSGVQKVQGGTRGRDQGDEAVEEGGN